MAGRQSWAVAGVEMTLGCQILGTDHIDEWRGQANRAQRALILGPNGNWWSDLLLKATRGLTIAVVSSRERKWWQPGLATDDPAFVGRHQLVRGIQGS
jgi:hypothetical protein